VPRAFLDQAILNAALARGAHFVRGRARALEFGEDRKATVLTACGEGKQLRLVARQVVASDGATSAMRGIVQADVPSQAVRAWGIRGYYATERALDDFFDVYVPLEVQGTKLPGYGWVFPVGERVANIGVGYFRRRVADDFPNLNVALDAFVEELRHRERRRFGDIQSLGRPTGSPLATNFHAKRSSSQMLVFAGDAAGTTDPFTGEGIAPAIESGMLAADCIQASHLRGVSLATYGRKLAVRMPRCGQDFSSLARLATQLEDGAHRLTSRLWMLGIPNAVLAIASDPDPRPDPHRTAVAALLHGMPAPVAAGMESVERELLEEIATSFPLATPVIARETRSHGGPVYAATLICAVHTFGGEPGEEAALGAQAAEYLAPFPVLLGGISHCRRGKLEKLNDALVVLIADFAISKSIAAVSRIGPDAALQLAQAARQVCEAGMMTAADRYDLHRTQDRYIDSVERMIGSVFAFAAGLGAELAGASPSAVRCARRYGCELGVAYQASEDLIELTAPVEGQSDLLVSLRRGVYSLPVLIAAGRDRRLRKRLTAGVGYSEISEIVQRIRLTGAMDDVRGLVDQRVESARAALAAAQCATVNELTGLADWVGARTDQLQRGREEAAAGEVSGSAANGTPVDTFATLHSPGEDSAWQ
jgi:flavin-dependent dehydrogenase